MEHAYSGVIDQGHQQDVPALKITHAFEQAQKEKRGVLIPYFMCGYPTAEQSRNIILAAAQSYQSALEMSALGHCLLTFSLVVDGLEKQRADDDPQDGRILDREWLEFATTRVPELQVETLRKPEARIDDDAVRLDAGLRGEPLASRNLSARRSFLQPQRFV